MTRIIAYTYYSNPWKLEFGDEVRIHMILATLAKSRSQIITFNLNAQVQRYTIKYNNVIYVVLPRKFYNAALKILKWESHYDLNPLMKITHYIDELLAVIILRKELVKTRAILVFGSMTLFSFITRLLGLKSIIMIYDPLANYAQTLYLRSRKSLMEILRYGLYLILHKLQVKSSDMVVYPSKIDLNNAKQMFKPIRTLVISNPSPICYNNLEEYINLRNKRLDHSRPYFILLAGGKSNEEAVLHTIKIFNNFPSNKFMLYITGPWNDYKSYVKNESIKILGVVSHEKLKELLAVCDYGLSPIFSHAAGTFIKILTYISAGLDIIASPQSITGIDLKFINNKIYLVHNFNEYSKVVKNIINQYQYSKNNQNRRPKICREITENLLYDITELMKFIENVK
jgi:glycosyltransferase involved in cell wall biosynthesis